MKFFCNHDWKVLSEIKTPSIVERYRDQKVSIRFDEWHFNKKLIHICSCKKCGKIKRYVTKY
jgi:hypothetical protein